MCLQISYGNDTKPTIVTDVLGITLSFSHFLWFSYQVCCGFLVPVFHIGMRSNPVTLLLADFEGNVIKEDLNRAFSVLSIQAHIFLTFLSLLIVGRWILDRAGQRSKNIL